MIRRISIAVLSLALALSAKSREEYTRTFDKTIPLHGGEQISIEHSLGDIVVRTHAQPEVVIHADIHVSASNQEQAKDFSQRVEISVEPSASELSIHTHYPANADFHFMHNVSYSVELQITIPETAPLQVRNSFGKVSAAGVRVSSEIFTSHGDLEFRDGRGAQRLEDSFANIHLAGNAGDVTVEDTNGSVDAADVTGALSIRDRFANVTVARATKGLTLINSNGNVDVSDSGGVGDIKNSFGNVTVRAFHGDLTINNSNGRVEADSVTGAAELNTTFGSVQFSDIGHQLSIRGGNSSIEGQRVGGPVTVQNSFGAITVSDVQGTVTIHSGNGSVSIAKIRGAATVKTSNAAFEGTDIAGMLNVENSNGAVRASNVRGAQVKTSFAAVILDAVSGPLQVTDQNGAVDVRVSTRGACQPVSIQTSFSPVQVRIDGEASYHLWAKTSFGKIRSDFPVTVAGSMSGDELNGTIGGGHCEMRVTDSNGTIEILKAGS